MWRRLGKNAPSNPTIKRKARKSGACPPSLNGPALTAVIECETAQMDCGEVGMLLECPLP
jgi:hypothetical protein